MPLLAFLFLVALGVDYNIFLVTRAAEESREHGARDGMLRALTATGGVITSAGILLAAVFAVLGVLPLVVLAQLGVVICVGVLLDTLVVRTVLVPAIALQLGDRFWWPRRRPGSAVGQHVGYAVEVGVPVEGDQRGAASPGHQPRNAGVDADRVEPAPQPAGDVGLVGEQAAADQAIGPPLVKTTTVPPPPTYDATPLRPAW